MTPSDIPIVLGGRYRLVEELGSGGMATVWAAHDELLGRRVAIKIPSAAVATQPDMVSRLLIEAQAVARLAHQHIAAVHDYGQSTDLGDAPVPYLVMEFVEGATLSTLLRSGEPMPWPQAVTIGAQVAAALAVAHERGIVHRDITPANVMITTGGVKVVDFGISAVMGQSDPDDEILGTAAYISPERLTDTEVAPPADVYALGLLLYRCLTGRLPWDATGVTQALHSHLHVPPMSLPPIEGLPAEVVDACTRSLAKDPEARPTSAELAHVLAAAVDSAHVPVVAHEGHTDTAAHTTVLPPAYGRPPVPAATLASMMDEPIRDGIGGSTGILAGRRPLAILAVAGAIGLGGVGWSLRDGTPPAQAQSDPSACLVTYTEVSDGPQRFHARLTVQETEAESARPWQLTFDMPHPKTVEAATAGELTLTVSQQNATVSIHSQSPEPSNASITEVQLTGTETSPGDIPTSFALRGQPCRSLAAGDTPAPSPATSPNAPAPETDTQRQPHGADNNGNDKKDRKGKGN
jgi:serine/threonine-protein kinase